MTSVFDSVDLAAAALREGRAVVVVDTASGVWHGWFVAAARQLTPELLGFMLRCGRGFLAVPVDQSICLKYGLRPLEGERPDGVTYALSFNLVDRSPSGAADCHGSQSTVDRAAAIRALVDPATSANRIRTPGFIHPVMTTSAGVLENPSVPSAATDLCRLAALEPAATMVAILSESGEMADENELTALAEAHAMPILLLRDLVTLRKDNVNSTPLRP